MKPTNSTRYSRMFHGTHPGGAYAPTNETALPALAQRMKDVPANRRGRRRGGQLPFSGFVYLAQFIDHDLSRDDTSLQQAGMPPELRTNARTACLDLDLLYGNGPELTPSLYDHSIRGSERFLLGRTLGVTRPGSITPIPSTFDDLHRPNGHAVLVDDRNDENLIVSQLTVLLLKAHNCLLQDLIDCKIVSAGPDGAPKFEQARRLLTWTYQWLVRNELLPMIVLKEVLHSVVADGPRLFNPSVGQPVDLPVEFTHAAFRFGHSMTQNVYNLNEWQFAVPLNKLINAGPPGAPSRRSPPTG